MANKNFALSTLKNYATWIVCESTAISYANIVFFLFLSPFLFHSISKQLCCVLVTRHKKINYEFNLVSMERILCTLSARLIIEF